MPMKKCMVLLVLIVLLFAVGCDGQAKPNTNEEPNPSGPKTFENVELSNEPVTVVFQNVNVIPMNKEQVLENQSVVIEEGIISEIGQVDAVTIPENAKIIDGEEKYLLPGLVDMHVHLGWNSEEEMLYLANGVTGIQNMWGRPEDLETREAINARSILGPRLYTTGPLMDGPDPYWEDSMILETAEEARNAVLQVQKDGYDAVKVYEMLSVDVYEEIMKTAKEIGIRVVGHVPQQVGLRKVAELKQDSIEHLSGYNLDNLGEEAMMVAENQVWNTPTFVIMHILKEEEEIEGLEYVNPDMIRYWKHLKQKGHYQFDLEKRQNILREIHEQGGRFLAGTDANNPFIVPGFSLHSELEYFVSAGLTSYEALKTATYNPAEFLGQLDQLGTVEEGKEADLILLSKNPLEDITNTKAIEGTMVQGIWLSNETLETELEKVRERYE